MAKNQGLVVKEVAAGSPAARAGLEPRDVIRRANGRPVNDIVDLRYQTSEESFEIEFVRDGLYRTVQIERE